MPSWDANIQDRPVKYYDVPICVVILILIIIPTFVIDFLWFLPPSVKSLSSISCVGPLHFKSDD